MNATEFKSGIKQIKDCLKGITLQFKTKNQIMPYFSLREFGNAILNEEAKGNAFKINFAFTENGLVGIQSLSHLAELIGSKIVTGVQIESYKECSNMWDAMAAFGGLD